MTRTLAEKVMEGFYSQGFRVLGWGGTWAGAMRPLEEYVKHRVERAVKAEREACARVCGKHEFALSAADEIRARGDK